MAHGQELWLHKGKRKLGNLTIRACGGSASEQDSEPSAAPRSSSGDVELPTLLGAPPGPSAADGSRQASGFRHGVTRLS